MRYSLESLFEPKNAKLAKKWVIAKDLLKSPNELAIINNRKAHYEGFKELEVVCLWEHNTSSVLAFFLNKLKVTELIPRGTELKSQLNSVISLKIIQQNSIRLEKIP